MELLFEFLTKELGHDPANAARTLWRDYQRGGRSDKPGFLKAFLLEVSPMTALSAAPLKRQARHGAAPAKTAVKD
jgi:hypothetical protein